MLRMTLALEQQCCELVAIDTFCVERASSVFGRWSLVMDGRAAAFETYMRRVYRAFEILDIKVDAEADEMTVDWAFRFRDVAPELTPVSMLPM